MFFAISDSQLGGRDGESVCVCVCVLGEGISVRRKEARGHLQKGSHCRSRGSHVLSAAIKLAGHLWLRPCKDWPASADQVCGPPGQELSLPDTSSSRRLSPF